MLEWWKLHPIIAPLPKGFMDEDKSHTEAKEWMDNATFEIEDLSIKLAKAQQELDSMRAMKEQWRNMTYKHEQTIREALGRIEDLSVQLVKVQQEAATAWDKCEERRMEGHAWFTELAKAREALTAIAEGNLGDDAWQANYTKIREVARAALTPAKEKGVMNG